MIVDRLVDSLYRSSSLQNERNEIHTYEMYTKWSDEERDVRNNMEGLPLS